MIRSQFYVKLEKKLFDKKNLIKIRLYAPYFFIN